MAAATYASQTITFAGTPAVGDTFTLTFEGLADTYTAVTGDTVLATLATHAAAQWAGVFTGVAFSVSGAVVTITALVSGTGPNADTVAVSKNSTGGTITAGGSNLTGGAAATESTLVSLKGYLIVDTRTDVELDTNAALNSSAFVHIETGAGNSGAITIGPILTSTAQNFVTGPCTVIVEVP